MAKRNKPAKAVQEPDEAEPGELETVTDSGQEPDKDHNIKGELASLQTEFDVIVRATESAVKAEDGARKSLYKSLEKLFEFGVKLFADMDLTKAFVTENQEPWNKRAREKPFLPLVKIAFKNTTAGEASRSKYTAVLQHAMKAKPGTVPFYDWVDGVDGKLEGRYQEAQGQPAAERTLQYNDEVKQARIADGERKVAKEKISQPISITPFDPLDTSYGYATALVRVLDADQIEIVRILESGREEVIHVMHDLGDRPRALREPLRSKPLFRLFRAIELVHTIADRPGQKDKRLLMIRNTVEQEKHVCRVMAVATMYDFTWAQVRIVGHDMPIPVGPTFAIPLPDAENFVRFYPKGGEYKIDAGAHLTDPKQPVILKHPKGQTLSIPLLPYNSGAIPDLRVGLWPDQWTQPVAFGQPTVDAIEGWKAEAKAFADALGGEQKIDRRIRSLAAVFTDDTAGKHYLRMSLANYGNIATNLWEVGSAFTIPQKRFVKTAVLFRLSEMVVAYGLTLEGGVADGPEPDNQRVARLALSETFDDGDELRAVMPFVVSIKGDYAKCCVRYQEP